MYSVWFIVSSCPQGCRSKLEQRARGVRYLIFNRRSPLLPHEMRLPLRMSRLSEAGRDRCAVQDPYSVDGIRPDRPYEVLSCGRCDLGGPSQQDDTKIRLAVSRCMGWGLWRFEVVSGPNWRVSIMYSPNPESQTPSPASTGWDHRSVPHCLRSLFSVEGVSIDEQESCKSGIDKIFDRPGCVVIVRRESQRSSA